MAYPELPSPVVAALSSRQMREHHMIWHYVREAWPPQDARLREELRAAGWEPPRRARTAGAGIDFLGMHRDMILKVNEWLLRAGDPTYRLVSGWAPIPWDHLDPAWPMPPQYSGGPPQAKEQAVTDRWRARTRERYENNEWLRSIDIDALGTELENGIHNWLHMHWAAEPWFQDRNTQDADDPRNDYLGDTYSSHVNKAFWKLHGWIDDRIGAWEAANGQPADLGGAWLGPATHHHMEPMAVGGSEMMIPDSIRTFSRNFFADRLER